MFIRIVNAKEHITFAVGGGSYFKLQGGNIEVVCPGNMTVKAGDYELKGATSMSLAAQTFPKSRIDFDQEFVLFLDNGEPVENRKFEVEFEDGGKIRGATDAQGKTGLKQAALSGKYMIKVLGPRQPK